MIKVCVGIPVYNGGDKLLSVISMVESQEVDFEYEIIVVDSGSSDGTLPIMRRMHDEKRISLIEIDKINFGHGKTRNLIVEQSKSELVAFLTQDALPASKYWLQELISPLIDDRNVAGVFGRHIAYPSSGEKTAYDIESFMNTFDNNERIVKIECIDEYNKNTGLRQFLHYYSDNNSCLRKSIWEKIQYPNVEYGEDQLWANEILLAGYSKGYAKKAEVYHSHKYGLKEIYERAKIDREFWVKYFSYTSVTNFLQVIKISITEAKNEVDWHRSSNRKYSSIKIIMQKFANFYGELVGYRIARK